MRSIGATRAIAAAMMAARTATRVSAGMPGTISAVVATVAIARTEAAGAAVAARTRAATDVVS